MKICKKCGVKKEINQFHYDRQNRDKHKTICKECRKDKKSHNILSESRKKLDRCIMLSVNRAIKENKSKRIWERVVGYTLYDLKKHLEKQFTKTMNWNNFGSLWWIDKIIPRAAYHYSINDGELKKCWSLKNLRPLLKNNCIRKKNKVYWSLIQQYKLYDILPLGPFIIEDKIDG